MTQHTYTWKIRLWQWSEERDEGSLAIAAINYAKTQWLRTTAHFPLGQDFRGCLEGFWPGVSYEVAVEIPAEAIRTEGQGG